MTMPEIVRCVRQPRLSDVHDVLWLIYRAYSAQAKRRKISSSRGSDAPRDIIHQYPLERRGDEDAVLVIDETGFLRQGEASRGVARQYTCKARVCEAQAQRRQAAAVYYGCAIEMCPTIVSNCDPYSASCRNNLRGAI